VQELRFHVQGTEARVTVSVGVSALQPQLPDGSEAEALLGSVDRALYEAKETGRNRVCTTPPRPPSSAPGGRRRLIHTNPPRSAGLAPDAHRTDPDFRLPPIPRFN
jgi:hypothetical protein